MYNQFESQRYNELFPSSDGDWIDISTMNDPGTWQRFLDRYSDSMCLLRPHDKDSRYAIDGYELIRVFTRDYGMVECIYRPGANVALGVTSVKTVDNDDGTYTHTYSFKVDN